VRAGGKPAAPTQQSRMNAKNDHGFIIIYQVITLTSQHCLLARKAWHDHLPGIRKAANIVQIRAGNVTARQARSFFPQKIQNFSTRKNMS